MKTRLPLPIPVRKALKKIGADIHDARIRRRITMQLMADRAGISRNTLKKVEEGDPSVKGGVYICVLYFLGMLDKVKDIADIANDPVGQAISSGELPKRVYRRRNDEEQ